MGQSADSGKTEGIIIMTLKRTIKCILTAALIVSMLLPFNACIFENGDSFAYAESDDSRYGRTQLENKAQRYIYDKYLTAIKGAKKTITLDYVKYSTTVDNFEVARYAVWKDYPEYAYWKYFDDKFYTIGSAEKKKVIKIALSYDSELKSKKNEYEARCKAIIKSIPKDCVTETQKAKYLNDVLGEIAVYRDCSSGGAYLYAQQVSYSPVVYGYAVCEGYAKAYSDLLRRAGIKSWVVYGYNQNDNAAADPDMNIIEYNGHVWVGHAWNMVWMDGKCLFCDPTSNDSDEIKLGIPFDHAFGKSYADLCDKYYFYDCTCDNDAVSEFQRKCIVCDCDESFSAASYRVEGEFNNETLKNIVDNMSTAYRSMDSEEGIETYTRAICLTSDDNDSLCTWLTETAKSNKIIFQMADMDGTCWYGSYKEGNEVWFYLISTEISENAETRELNRPIVAIRKNTSKLKVYLNWYEVDNADKYKVYRSTSKNGKYKLVKTTSSLKYTDSDVSKGKTYYYKVKAVDEERSSAYSVLCSTKIS